MPFFEAKCSGLQNAPETKKTHFSKLPQRPYRYLALNFSAGEPPWSQWDFSLQKQTRISNSAAWA